MTAPIRFLFDECLSHIAMAQLRLMIPDCPEFDHIALKYGQKSKDPVWIPQIVAEGGWVVLTADRGKKSKRNERLPRLCVEFGLTHVLFSAAIHREKMDIKRDAIFALWDQLVQLDAAPVGSRHIIKYKSMRGGKQKLPVLEHGKPQS